MRLGTAERPCDGGVGLGTRRSRIQHPSLGRLHGLTLVRGRPVGPAIQFTSTAFGSNRKLRSAVPKRVYAQSLQIEWRWSLSMLQRIRGNEIVGIVEDRGGSAAIDAIRASGEHERESPQPRIERRGIADRLDAVEAAVILAGDDADPVDSSSQLVAGKAEVADQPRGGGGRLGQDGGRTGEGESKQ